MTQLDCTRVQLGYWQLQPSSKAAQGSSSAVLKSQSESSTKALPIKGTEKSTQTESQPSRTFVVVWDSEQEKKLLKHPVHL